MKTAVTFVLTDPVYTPKHHSAFDQFWLKRLRDKRDLPFIGLTIRITLLMIPLAVLIFLVPVTGWLWWSLVIAYHVVNNFVFKGPFGLMLHCTSHRSLFNEQNRILNFYLPWVIGPFFGQTPETYAAHHLAMHHRENNLEDDLSSTMHYQRDSFADFLKYFGSFFFTVIPTLAIYFNQKDQVALRNRVIRGELFFWIACAGLCFISWQSTLAVFVVPLLISRLIMMVGNWAQHSFVDNTDPANFYKNSVTCINTKYNHKCWNDGYHISHHIKPNLHWTAHPDHLLSNVDQYVINKALIFENIHFLHIWWFLMTNNYTRLAKNVVNLGNMFASEEEAIKLMKSRTQKFARENSK